MGVVGERPRGGGGLGRAAGARNSVSGSLPPLFPTMPLVVNDVIKKYQPMEKVF